MAKKILRLPKGLQDFLGNTNMGENPSDLSNVVAPTLNMDPFYLADNLFVETSEITLGPTGAGAAEGGFFLSVPDGEVWYLFAASVGYRLTVSGGGLPKLYSALRFDNYPGAQGPVTTQPFLSIGEPSLVMKVAGATSPMAVQTTYFGGNYFPVPGGVNVRFRYWLDDIGAVPEVEVAGTLWYVRLKA